MADPATGSTRQWTLAAVASVMTTVLVITVLIGIELVTRPGDVGGSALSLVAEVFSVGVVLVLAHQITPRLRDVVTALGLFPPRWADLRTAVPAFVLQWVSLLVFSILVTVIFRGFSLKEASNTTGLDHASALALVLFGIAAVVLAPVVEETMFRGFILRAAMRRMPFAPAALLSSVIFGLFHTYEASTLAGAAVLGLHMVVFGFVQCYVVRRTGRLATSVTVHATFNLVAILSIALR